MSRQGRKPGEPKGELPGIRRSRFVAYGMLALGALAVLTAFFAFKVRVFVAGGKFLLTATVIVLAVTWVFSRFNRP